MRTRLAPSALLLACLVLPVAALDANAASIGGVEFRDSVAVGETELSLRGLGRVYYLRWFEVYVGGVYLPDGVGADEVLGDVPKRLELRYTRTIRDDQLIEAGDEFLSRNLSEAEYNEIREPLARLNALYETVDEGDRYTLTYIPGKGTELARNGEPKGVVEGARFAELYFSIWLGQRPLSAKFKNAVLGGEGL